MASIDCIYITKGLDPAPERSPDLGVARVALVTAVAEQMNRQHSCFGQVENIPWPPTEGWEQTEGACFRLTPRSDYDLGMGMYGFFLRLCGGMQPDAVVVDHEGYATMIRHYEGSFWGHCETPMVCDRNPDPIKLSEIRVRRERWGHETKHPPHWRSYSERVIRVLHEKDKIPVDLDVATVSFDTDICCTHQCCLCDGSIHKSTFAYVSLAPFKGREADRRYVCMHCLFDEVGGPPPVDPISYPEEMAFLNDTEEKIAQTPVIEIPEE